MGLFSHLLSMSIGAYAGAYIAQNYEVPKLPSPSQFDLEKTKEAMEKSAEEAASYFQISKVPSLPELSKRIEDYMSQYKKTGEGK